MDAGVAETHISTLFFTATRAYKLPKPIRTPFLDQSTPALRGEACRRELELNRRLAPDVYLGIGELREGDAIADYVLVMRRLPADRRLSVLLATPERDDALRAVARAVAAFHLRQPADDRAAVLASPAGIARLWEANFAELDAIGADAFLDRARVAAARALAEQYVAGRGPLFERRVAQGWARDGHGDLLADDIFCLPDGPRILDCLAFDDDLRLGDVLSDIAFLAMDVERLAGAGASRLLLAAYQDHASEQHPASLADHYIAYRAFVRAKVACLRAQQLGERTAPLASAHVDQALRHLEAAIPRLVLVGGAPGTGKSTVAGALGARSGFTVIRSDVVRKELAGLGPAERVAAPVGEGLYRPELTEHVYGELLARARTHLALGETVVLDASWTSGPAREAARSAARDAAAQIVELRCAVDPAEARRRVAERLAGGHDASDATPAVADHLAAAAAPWPEATVLDTAQPVATVVDAARVAVAEACARSVRRLA